MKIKFNNITGIKNILSIFFISTLPYYDAFSRVWTFDFHTFFCLIVHSTLIVFILFYFMHWSRGHYFMHLPTIFLYAVWFRHIIWAEKSEPLSLWPTIVHKGTFQVAKLRNQDVLCILKIEVSRLKRIAF